MVELTEHLEKRWERLETWKQEWVAAASDLAARFHELERGVSASVDTELDELSFRLHK